MFDVAGISIGWLSRAGWWFFVHRRAGGIVLFAGVLLLRYSRVPSRRGGSSVVVCAKGYGCFGGENDAEAF